MASSKGGGLSSVMAGLLVALAAAVPVVWTVTNGGADETVAEIAEVATIQTSEPAPVTETIVVTPEPVEVDGLPESVVRALEAAGNVRQESHHELGLPESIVAVLAEHDVVLKVAEEAAP